MLLQSSKGLRAIGKRVDIESALPGFIFCVTPFCSARFEVSDCSEFAKKTLGYRTYAECPCSGGSISTSKTKHLHITQPILRGRAGRGGQYDL